MNLAVNTLQDLFSNKNVHETLGQGKRGQGQTGREDRYFWQGTSANKEGHDGTGLRGCRSIQAFHTLLLSE